MKFAIAENNLDRFRDGPSNPRQVKSNPSDRSGRARDLSAALAAARETRALELSPGALEAIPELLRRWFPGQSAVVVADANTFKAAGRKVLDLVLEAGATAEEPVVFPGPGLVAEQRHVVALEERLKVHPATIPLAVGSGTINDLVKLAAHRAHRRYLAVATAASMDGYTAFGASIDDQGSKQTVPCPAPLAAVADLDVSGVAPPELNAAGYADLVAKLTAGADWLLADALGVEPLHAAAWSVAQDDLRDALAEPAGVRGGEPGAIGRLTTGLMLTGFAMQAASSSRPASGAEHQFSHLWDMEHHTFQGKVPLHGYKVGIGSLAAAALYEYVLKQPLEELDVDRCCAEWPDDAARENLVRDLFGGSALAGVALRESAAKASSRVELRTQLESLRGRWSQLRDRLRRQLIPFTELKKMLRAAGAPVEPDEVGISRERLRAAYVRAYFIRRRFTILDLGFRTGLLESGLAHIFGGGGPWSSDQGLKS